jgi:GTP-binding protein
VESAFLTSATKPAHYPVNEFADIAFAGKSNVGKSSFINTITGRKLLAKVSSTPGKTRLLNFFLIRFKLDDIESQGSVNFVDLPGYGFAKVHLSEKESWKQMISDYTSRRAALRGFLLLVDIRHAADAKDKMLVQMLEENKIPYCICATKADKISKNRIPETLRKLKMSLAYEHTPIFAVSSLYKTGMEAVLQWIYFQIENYQPSDS